MEPALFKPLHGCNGLNNEGRGPPQQCSVNAFVALGVVVTGGNAAAALSLLGNGANASSIRQDMSLQLTEQRWHVHRGTFFGINPHARRVSGCHHEQQYLAAT